MLPLLYAGGRNPEAVLVANKAVRMLVLAMALWGGAWPAGKAIAHTGNFHLTNLIRFMMAALVLRIYLWRNEEKTALGRSALPVALASVAMLGYNIAYFAGLQMGTASAGGVIVTTLNPLFTAFFANAILFATGQRHNLRFRQICGLLLGLAGGMIMLEIWQKPEILARNGNLWFLAGAALWAVITILSRLATKITSAMVFTYTSFLWVAVGSAVIVSVLPTADLMTGLASLDQKSLWAGMVYLAVFSSALGSGIYFSAVPQIGSQRAASFTFLVPGFAVFTSWIALGEVPAWNILAGGAAALCGVYLLNPVRSSS